MGNHPLTSKSLIQATKSVLPSSKGRLYKLEMVCKASDGALRSKAFWVLHPAENQSSELASNFLQRPQKTPGGIR